MLTLPLPKAVQQANPYWLKTKLTVEFEDACARLGLDVFFTISVADLSNSLIG